MNRKEFVEFIYRVAKELENLFLKKNQVYGKDNDVLSNIRQIAKFLKIDEHIVLAVLMSKHLNVILRGDAFCYDDIDERVKDVILYLLLMLVLIQEKK